MLIAQIETVGQIRCIFDDSQSGVLMNTIRLLLRGTDQSCVLVIIIMVY